MSYQGKGSAGTSPQWNGTKWINTTISGGGGFQTIYEVDYSTLSNQNLLTGGAGNKIIDGITYDINTVSSLSSANIVNGTGIVFVQNTTASGYFFSVKLQNISASLYPFSTENEVEISFQATISAMSSSNEILLFRFDDSPTVERCSVGFIYNGASKNVFFRYVDPPLASYSPLLNQTTSNNTDDCFIIHIKNASLLETKTGLFSSGWPKDCSLRGWRQHSSQTSQWVARGNEAKVGFEYYTESNVNGRTITLKKMRIRIK